MNETELYQKLVDMYAGEELPQELMDELESAALSDSKLAWEMQTMRSTVQRLRSLPGPDDVQASLENVIRRLRQEGVEIADDGEPRVYHLQHYLPISG